MTTGQAYEKARQLYAQMDEEAIHLAADRMKVCEMRGDAAGRKDWDLVGKFLIYFHTGRVGSDCAKFGM